MDACRVVNLKQASVGGCPEARRNRDVAAARGVRCGAEECRRREIRARCDELAGRHDSDDAQQIRDARVPDRDGAAEWHALHAEGHRIFWESHGPARHHVIVGQLPTLYECFNQGDILISDVSSVVADFVASLKPYVLTNAQDLPDDDFRAACTTAGGAYLLYRAGARLPQILSPVPASRQDPTAPHRRTIKEYVLGPDHPHLHGAIQRSGQRPGRQGRGEAGAGQRGPAPGVACPAAARRLGHPAQPTAASSREPTDLVG
ncbi:hypothetical protein [Streptomyces sp. NRRL S-646]|uniref:hypothetical protein n=1 Tax=Streptomyces sp. NRRL S-646 TaxID=1463917 RepID=UPI0004C91D08|nr:hypothetical protein [Streptomyces sp. NRRL S-646]